MLLRCTICQALKTDPNDTTCEVQGQNCGGRNLVKAVCIHWARPIEDGETPHIEPQYNSPQGIQGPPKLKIHCISGEMKPGTQYSPLPSAVTCPSCLEAVKAKRDAEAQDDE